VVQLGPGVRAAARTDTRAKFAARASSRGSWVGRLTGPAQVSGVLVHPRARAAIRVSQVAGGVLTGPRPAPAAGVGRTDRARATRTTLPPETRPGGRGQHQPQDSDAEGRGRATRTSSPAEPQTGNHGRHCPAEGRPHVVKVRGRASLRSGRARSLAGCVRLGHTPKPPVQSIPHYQILGEMLGKI
jgi:hypothetical protein